MSKLLPQPEWTEGQRQFVSALEQAGANSAEHAVPIDRAFALRAPELQALIDSGFVREASANGYYVYARQVRLPAVSSQFAENPFLSVETKFGRQTTKVDGRRFLKAMVFWIIIILIPIILLQLIGSKR